MNDKLHMTNYQVLARKWRPKNFHEVVGQEHVVRTLSNALEQNRLHHAYLFSGTRGVGKTSIARILAKCFNCEVGLTASPCGKCDACLEIDHGKFIDLIEVDAASRTRVEDTRELLDNVQYLPVRGRYKVYLIDEVHMLSGHSFNALLKTLEEPPQHIKFLLATTDPQKLPITVLSRCLQFNLQLLTPEYIQKQLQTILSQEQIVYEEDALWQLALAARGSMRDALSLLDQAIAFGRQRVVASEVKKMLGTIDTDKILALLEEIIAGHSMEVLALARELGELAVDFGEITDKMLEVLYKISLLQLMPDTNIGYSQFVESMQKIAVQVSQEEIQLYYQIALLGKRDLVLAPNPQMGFEMFLIRMLAFRPEKAASLPLRNASDKSIATSDNDARSKQDMQHNVRAQVVKAVDEDLLLKLNMNGPTGALLKHCILESICDNEVKILLDPEQAPLMHNQHADRISIALSKYYNSPMIVKLELGTTNMLTPAKRQLQEKQKKREHAWQELVKDDNIQELINKFGAEIINN